MAEKDWNGFKKNGDTYIPNDATARAGLQNKVDKVSGKGLSTNDYSDADKAIVDGVTSGLAGKVDKVTGKGLSTNDYDNTAKGIVDTAQDNIKANTKLIKDTVGWSGKNKLRNDIVSQTLHTTVISVNADKSVSFTNAPNNELWLTVNGDIRLSAGRYKLSGCPSGGGTTKYFLRFVVRDAGDTANEETYFDYGTGTEFEITSATAGRKCTCSIYIKSGQETGFTFYPMLRDADILDSTYEPYFGSTAFPRSEQAVLGAKNLWKKTTLASTTSDTITWSQNDDNTVTANTSAPTTGRAFVNAGSIKLPVGRYKLSGCPNGGSLTDGYYLRLQINSPSVVILADDVGNGAEFNVSDSNATMVMYICFEKAGLSANNLVFKPMITFATDTESDYAHYVPYAMTNKELTDALADTGWKQLETNSTNVASGSVRYRIKAGICYVQIASLIFSNTGSSLEVASDLPKSEFIMATTSIASSGSDMPTNNGFFLNANSIKLQCHVEKAGIQNFATFSYPVM